MAIETTTIDVDALLAPIPGAKPAGENVEYSPQMDALKRAVEVAQQKQGQPLEEAREFARKARLAEKEQKPGADQMVADAEKRLSPAQYLGLRPAVKEWTDVRKLAVEILTRKSKDLYVASTLCEALFAANGFAGLEPGLIMVRRLNQEFWDGLYPELNTESREPTSDRVRPLEGLFPTLVSAIRAFPLIDRTNMTAQHIAASATAGEAGRVLRRDGWPSAQTVQKALTAMGAVKREAAAAEVAGCRRAAEELRAVLAERFADSAPSLEAVVSALSECEQAIAPPKAAPEQPQQPAPEDTKIDRAPTAGGNGAAAGDDLRARAMELVRQNNLEGLKLAHQHFADAKTGRERFMRQLALAQVCIEAGVHALAYPLLDELGEIADSRQLQVWEDVPFIAEMWTALESLGPHMAKIKPDAEERCQQAAQRREQLQPTPAPAAAPAEEEEAELEST